MLSSLVKGSPSQYYWVSFVIFLLFGCVNAFDVDDFFFRFFILVMLNVYPYMPSHAFTSVMNLAPRVFIRGTFSINITAGGLSPQASIASFIERITSLFSALYFSLSLLFLAANQKSLYIYCFYSGVIDTQELIQTCHVGRKIVFSFGFFLQIKR